MACDGVEWLREALGGSDARLPPLLPVRDTFRVSGMDGDRWTIIYSWRRGDLY
jgi:hypothetical protein